jgi:tRNA nucleotidyltransferase (CCA-adding enzyme)
VLKTLESCDALRRPERFADFLLACEAGRPRPHGFRAARIPTAEFFQRGARTRGSRGTVRRGTAGLSGEQIGQELRRRRLAAIEEFKAT